MMFIFFRLICIVIIILFLDESIYLKNALKSIQLYEKWRESIKYYETNKKKKKVWSDGIQIRCRLISGERKK